MKFKTVMMESSKNKFLNQICKVPKSYDYFLGVVIEDFNGKINAIREQCEKFADITEGHLQLLEITMIDDDLLLLFASDPLFYNSNIKGIVKSICKYIDCEYENFNYSNTLQSLVFDAWGTQKYHTLSVKGTNYNLKFIKEIK